MAGPYYVRSDAAGGSTGLANNAATAWTLAEFNLASPSAGETVYFVGTFSQAAGITANDAGVIIDGSLGVTFTNSAGAGATISASSVTLKDFTFHGCASHGVTLTGAITGVLVKDVVSRSNAAGVGSFANGFNITGPTSGSDWSERHVFSGCQAIGNGGHGFLANGLSRYVTYTSCIADGNGVQVGAHGFSLHPNRNNISTGAAETPPGSSIYKSQSTIGYTVTLVGNLTDQSVWLTKNVADPTNPASGEWGQDSGYVYFNIGGAITGKDIYCFDNGANYVTYTNCVARNTVAYGGAEGAGFQPDDAASYVTTTACWSYDNDGVGFANNRGNYNKWHGCVAYGNALSGFSVLTAPSINNEIVNCVSARNGSTTGHHGFQWGYKPGQTGSVLQNCVAYGNTGKGVSQTTGSYITLTYNDFYLNADGNDGASLNGAYITRNPATQWTYDPQLSSAYAVGNSLLKGTGVWRAGVRGSDDLPIPLNPDLGAVQDRTAPGRRFGAGVGTL